VKKAIPERSKKTGRDYEAEWREGAERQRRPWKTLKAEGRWVPVQDSTSPGPRLGNEQEARKRASRMATV